MHEYRIQLTLRILEVISLQLYDKSINLLKSRKLNLFVIPARTQCWNGMTVFGLFTRLASLNLKFTTLKEWNFSYEISSDISGVSGNSGTPFVS